MYKTKSTDKRMLTTCWLVGWWVRRLVGLLVGLLVCPFVGLFVGLVVGSLVGLLVCPFVGLFVGWVVGSLAGLFVGYTTTSIASVNVGTLFNIQQEDIGHY
jgi:hypothetical protein